MKLGDFHLQDLYRQAANEGLGYQTGPFAVRVYTDQKKLVQLLHTMYAHSPLLADGTFCHFHIRLHAPFGLRRWLKPQVLFSVDGITPFDPFAAHHAFPLFEWGLNWCIGSAANSFLILHSAVVEKHGLAAVLPALPGSGKSTLCAALIHNGWRLLSDEFGIVDTRTGELIPLPRSIPLKNESIDIIRAFAPSALLGPTFLKTRKGDVAHVAPPRQSILRQSERAKPRLVIFPKYTAGAPLTLTPIKKSLAFTRLSNNSFNYQVAQAAGFTALGQLIADSDTYNLHYSALDEAITQFDTLAESWA